MAIIWESANWIFNPLTVTGPNKRKPFMGDKRKFVMKLVALQCMVKSLPKIYFGGDFSLSLSTLSFPSPTVSVPSLLFRSFLSPPFPFATKPPSSPAGGSGEHCKFPGPLPNAFLVYLESRERIWWSQISLNLC